MAAADESPLPPLDQRLGVLATLLTRDTAQAREFWGSLFGWQWQTFEGPTEYHMTRFSETTGGAIYAPDPPDKRGPRVYFDVDDINAGNARVKELGGDPAREGLVGHQRIDTEQLVAWDPQWIVIGCGERPCAEAIAELAHAHAADRGL